LYFQTLWPQLIAAPVIAVLGGSILCCAAAEFGDNFWISSQPKIDAGGGIRTDVATNERKHAKNSVNNDGVSRESPETEHPGLSCTQDTIVLKGEVLAARGGYVMGWAHDLCHLDRDTHVTLWFGNKPESGGQQHAQAIANHHHLPIKLGSNEHTGHYFMLAITDQFLDQRRPGRFYVTVSTNKDVPTTLAHLKGSGLPYADITMFDPPHGVLDNRDLVSDLRSSHPEFLARNVDNFGVSHYWLTPNCGGVPDYCGPENMYASLVEMEFFSEISTHFKMGVQVGVLKNWQRENSCGAGAEIDITHGLIEFATQAGGRVDYLALDSPMFNGHYQLRNHGGCGLDLEMSVQRYTQFINSIHQKHPELWFFAMDPYPIVSVDQTIAYYKVVLDRLHQQSSPGHLDAFAIDISRKSPLWEHISEQTFRSDMQRLKIFFESEGVAFAPIIWSEETNSSDDYQKDIRQWVDHIAMAMNDLPFRSFMSWHPRTNTGHSDIPFTLKKPGVYSHSQIMQRELAVLLNYDSVTLNVDAPKQVNRGETFSVSVEVLNNGSALWMKRRKIRLGISDSESATLWNTNGRIELDTPYLRMGDTATLKVELTAPDQKGSHTMTWQMVAENVLWFGDKIMMTVDVH